MPTEETITETDHATTWALADKIMSISYGYAIAMHESIQAGRGAVGWQDFKQAAQITTVLGEFLIPALAQAREAGRREAAEAVDRTVDRAKSEDCDWCLGVMSALANDLRRSK